MSKYILILCGILVLASCKKDEPVDNPFDQQGQGQQGQGSDTLNPESIAGLHKQIFSVRCANPLCHDGSFEPDFRTIQSTYSNLVYHQVIKNTTNNDFTYRVIPYDPENSWLIERLTTTDPVLGRMPLYADPLNAKEMGHIKAWINAGCPDINGNPAKFPNLKPQVLGRAAFDANQNRLDTVLSGGRFSAFVLPPNTEVSLLFLVRDDSTSPENLTLNQVRFSENENDFSNSTLKVATHFTADYFAVQFNSNEFPQDKQIFFRYYVKDEHNSSPTEFPFDGSPFYFKENFSFIVQ